MRGNSTIEAIWPASHSLVLAVSRHLRSMDAVSHQPGGKKSLPKKSPAIRLMLSGIFLMSAMRSTQARSPRTLDLGCGARSSSAQVAMDGHNKMRHKERSELYLSFSWKHPLPFECMLFTIGAGLPLPNLDDDWLNTSAPPSTSMQASILLWSTACALCGGA